MPPRKASQRAAAAPKKAATAVKKAPAKKPAVKKTAPAKKPAVKKTAPAKKTAVKKAVVTAAKKAPAKKKASAAPASPQKAKASKKAPASPTKSKPTGLGGFAPGKLVRNNTLDAGLAGLDAALASNAEVHDDMSASMVFVDAAKNTDKYYILQLLAHKKQPATFYVFNRWGRTGTGGQAQIEGPVNENDAKKIFEKKFKDKSGLPWSSRSAPPKSGKYEYMQPSSAPSGPAGKWQYHLTKDPMGKADGWYDYDADNNKEVELVYQTYVANKRMCTRFVHSESSGFTYEVNLSSLMQTNTSSGKSRPIRRQ